MKKTLFIFFITSLISVFSANAKGYKIKCNIKDTTHSKYVLYTWKWGKKYAIDSTNSSSTTKYFKGKTQLKDGLYSIEQITNNKKNNLLEFIVPKNCKNFKSTFFIDTIPPYNTVKKGNKENKLFTEFQNLVKYQWKEYKDVTSFKNAVTALKNIAQQNLKGSLVNIILQNTLSTPNSADELLTLLELNNPTIINTHFAPKHVQLYLKAIELNSNDTIIYKANNLISQTKDNNLKLLLASEIFNYFSNSKIMGQEEVAVKIAEQWLLNKDINIAKGQDLFIVKTFVEFNKNSLIGMPSPELNLIDTSGNSESLNNLSGEYTIIYFYSDDCLSCKIETPQLIDFLDEYKDGLINVYAVYTKDNTEKWKNYINKEFNTYNPFVTWVNVYDPNFSSGFELLYNVIKTPQIYLLDSEHKIIGRGLNIKALKELINIKNKEKDDFKRLLSAYFTPINNNKSEVYKTIDQFYNKSIKNTKLFNEIFRELYNFLGSNNNYTLQEGAVYLAENYIISKPQLWNKSFVNQAIKAIEIFNKNKLGEQANNLILELPDKSSQTLYNSPTTYKILYFYRPNCGTCSTVTPKLAELYNNYKEKIDIELYAINLSSNYTEWIKYISNINADFINLRGLDGNSSDIYKNYYINNIPAIYLLKDNIVIAKDINDIDLELFLKELK